ncbi:hypothetical protein LY76DRAFT_590318 [Colletotrichum caudatum]|nr:hypothetical protein LY76DRAFT_590318 [Colletotrichum caudatum]
MLCSLLFSASSSCLVPLALLSSPHSSLLAHGHNPLKKHAASIRSSYRVAILFILFLPPSMILCLALLVRRNIALPLDQRGV